MTGFAVVELQTALDGSIASLIYGFGDATKTEDENRADAEEKYHSVLMYAAKSSLPCHAAVIMRNDGSVINKQAYRHEEE